jgi:hypothetical protein
MQTPIVSAAALTTKTSFGAGGLTTAMCHPLTMTPRFKRVVLFACAHALVTLALSFYYTSAITEPVRPGSIPEISDRAAAAGLAADILMLPGYLLWTPWASKHLPNLVEWLLFLANSVVWGLLISAALALCYRILRAAR